MHDAARFICIAKWNQVCSSSLRKWCAIVIFDHLDTFISMNDSIGLYAIVWDNWKK